jgi:hypothetical protein
LVNDQKTSRICLLVITAAFGVKPPKKFWDMSLKKESPGAGTKKRTVVRFFDSCKIA